MPAPKVTVEDFSARHGEALQLKLLAGKGGLKRLIAEGAVNRPGLALAGFTRYFAAKRIQVFGFAENHYLHSISGRLLRARAHRFFASGVPCAVFARSINPPEAFLEEADKLKVPIFKCPLITMRFVNHATIFLEEDFAPTCTEHGSMVDIQGIGVMLRGGSGIGKSECVLSLLERGYSLVADDVTKLRLMNGSDLVGTSSEITRNHMEVRGIGIINVMAMFGVGAIRLEKVLNIVVSLEDWEKVADVDRLGLDREFYEILGIKVPHVTIPVRPGRDISRLVEVAALDQKLKSMGSNAALELNRRLIQKMAPPP
ncbi:MAG: HPr(Ser) kinase/phosphatase [Verrucomicrobiae bacterium]|nr:HPr(Ser) kinase/phosphatase [Verrucomicrobiae bacterium]